MEKKPLLASKTFWFNVVTGGLAIAAELSQIFPVSDHPKLWVSVIAIGNLILRVFFTEKPIGSEED